MRADTPVANLPHGDQRKLEVALMLALEPEVFMFDEPTAGMSVDEVPVILDLIADIKNKQNKVILLVEHKMDVVRSLSDRIVVLHNGELVADGEPVFVDVTATWCLSCQVNKQTTLTADAVRQAFADAGVTTVRADWTDQDPAITAFLDRFGRNGVPLYVFFPGGDADPVLLPEVLTPGIVLDAIAAHAPQTASL